MLEINVISNSGSFLINSYTVTYYIKEVGKHIFELITIDDFNEQALISISLDVFHNLNPICIIEVKEVLGNSLERIIDASKSYDKRNLYMRIF